jgi:hypothetical protein
MLESKIRNALRLYDITPSYIKVVKKRDISSGEVNKLKVYNI